MNDFSKATNPNDANDMLGKIMSNLEAKIAAAKAAAPAPAQAASSGYQSEPLFSMMATYLSTGEGKPTVEKLQAIFQMEITPKKGAKPGLVYTIDMKNGAGKIVKGKTGDKVDATFTMVDADYASMANGKLNPQIAFMQGKMKIKGNLAKATKFTPELFPAPTAENIAKYGGAKL